MEREFSFLKKVQSHLRLALIIGGSAFALQSYAQTSGDNGSHDPSRMLECDGKVYIYSTGGGGKSSADGLVWKNIVTPPWNLTLLPNNQRIWAPDGIFLNDQYYLYGSMWSDTKASMIVLLTSPTLNPDSPNYKWTDQGVAIDGPKGVTHSCIDAAPVLDAQGNLWVVFGGGYPFGSSENSIILTRMDNKTGLALKTDPGYKSTALPGYALKQGHKEGPYIHYHNKFYYVFWQQGSCCSGTASTYTVWVARATSITGPYTGDKVFFGRDAAKNINGPGHMGIYSCSGKDYFTYHYYPTNGSVIGVNALSWTTDDWPKNDGQISSGLKLPCLPTGITVSSNVQIKKETIQTRKSANGFEFLIANNETGKTQEIFNMQGKKIYSMKATSGWNLIPKNVLAAGVNVLRISGGKQGLASVVVDNW